MLKRTLGAIALAIGLIPGLLEWAEHGEFIEHHVPVVAEIGGWLVSHLHISIPILCAVLGLVLISWDPMRSWLRRPTFVPVEIVKNDTTTPPQYQLMVKNIGEPFDGHIVKLMEFRHAGDGQEAISPGKLPVALKTITSANHANPTARFNLATNEPKQVFICSFNQRMPGVLGDAGLHIETDGEGWNFCYDEESGFAAVIGLFGRTHSECIVYIAINRGITCVTLLDEKTEKETRKRWAAAAKSRSIALAMTQNRRKKTPSEQFPGAFPAPNTPPTPLPATAFEPIPDWQIQELFYLAEPDLRSPESDPFSSPTGDVIKDRLSTGQLRSWGRQGENGTLVEIPADYWRHADWSYFFLSPDEVERRMMEHVHRAAFDHSDAPDYWDVQVSRTQAVRLWSAA